MTPAPRGRPILFDEHAQARYLALVADGMRLAPAATAVGVDRRTITYAGKRNPHFAEALATAKARGRTARIPHGTPEGYDNYGCRDTCCRSIASKARAGRRERAHTTGDGQGGEVVPLPSGPPTRPELASSFPLAAAS